MENKKQLLKKIGKWFLIVFGILIVAYLVFAIYYYNHKQAMDTWLDNARYNTMMQPFRLEQKRLEDAQKADTFGGKTPEETLNMYLEALKKGDIELASKYCVVENQEDEQLNLRRVLKEKGNLAELISGTEIYLGRKVECTTVDRCRINYSYITDKQSTSTGYLGNKKIEDIIPAGTKIDLHFGFVLNKNTNVWKISN